ncbi:MAG TPA: hypothetical protein VK395_37130, partial [Gemmataceae bacterium]|nr:hypothetical protein [Gemmataceae bacterium]
VEVDADVLHGGSPFVETDIVKHAISGLPRTQRTPPVGFGLLHSFTQHPVCWYITHRHLSQAGVGAMHFPAS